MNMNELKEVRKRQQQQQLPIDCLHFHRIKWKKDSVLLYTRQIRLSFELHKHR